MDFTNSISTQASNNCSLYSVTDTSNYGTNDQAITESSFTKKIVGLRMGTTNQLLGEQTVPLSQKQVDFDISTVTSVQILVSQTLVGDTSSTLQVSKTLPCLLNI